MISSTPADHRQSDEDVHFCDTDLQKKCLIASGNAQGVYTNTHITAEVFFVELQDQVLN